MSSRPGPSATPSPDEAALADLRRDLLASIRRACPASLAAQAEDLVQIALIRLMDHASERGGIGAFPASYLRRAALNAVIDEIRRAARRAEEQEGDLTPFAAMPSGGPTPEAVAAAAQLREGLIDCLRGMIAGRRQAVVCHLQGFSAPETSRFLGWSVKKAEHLVQRGLGDLRLCLSGKGLAP